MDEDNSVSLLECATKKQPKPLQIIQKTLESSTGEALNASNKKLPGIVQCVNGTNKQMKLCMDKMQILLNWRVSQECSQHKKRSLMCPSANTAFETETRLFHKEKDSNCAMSCVPKLDCKVNNSITQTGFQFEISENVTMNVPLSCGTTILFHACLLTNRQNMKLEKLSVINVGL